MRHAAHEAARTFLDAFAEDLVNTDDAGFERKLDDWTNRGFPELAFYRGDRPRTRGEIVAEIAKAQRALDGDDRALIQTIRDELPVMAGALRVAAVTEQAEMAPSSYSRPDYDSRFPDKWAAKGWGGPRGPYQIPTLNDEADRVANMQADGPARFLVNENPDADSWPQENDDPWRGWHAVRENDALIEEAAEKYGIDSDLMRAIVWMENTRYSKGGLDELGNSIALLGDSVGLHDSLGLLGKSSLPMNIQREKWARLIGVDPGELRKPEKNIEAGAALLQKIINRTEDPTPEKIGSVWIYSGRENVNDYGAHVGRIYEKKPWLEREPLPRGFKSETFP